MTDSTVEEVACPHCRSTDTELFSLFGTQLLTVQYYCRACRTPFERIKGPDSVEAAKHRSLRGLIDDES